MTIKINKVPYKVCEGCSTKYKAEKAGFCSVCGGADFSQTFVTVEAAELDALEAVAEAAQKVVDTWKGAEDKEINTGFDFIFSDLLEKLISLRKAQERNANSRQAGGFYAL